MYRVIGVDGKEYGPIGIEQLKQWIAQGRVNPGNRVKLEGTPDWKIAADFPEVSLLFAAPAGAIAPGATPPPVNTSAAEGKKGLAVTSLILGIFAFPTCFLTGIPAIICGHIAYHRARRAPAEFGGAGMATAGLVLGYASLLIAFFALAFGAALLPAFSKAKARAQQINCVNEMKQIGLAMRTWALDHGDQFPFNVSTNAGGTLELCAPTPNGFDRNAAIHFMVLSNELGSPNLLVCPADSARTPAPDFQHLQAFNVTYQLRTGTNVSDSYPTTVLAICPIHGSVLLCDGSVQQTNKSRWGR